MVIPIRQYRTLNNEEFDSDEMITVIKKDGNIISGTLLHWWGANTHEVIIDTSTQYYSRETELDFSVIDEIIRGNGVRIKIFPTSQFLRIYNTDNIPIEGSRFNKGDVVKITYNDNSTINGRILDFSVSDGKLDSIILDLSEIGKKVIKTVYVEAIKHVSHI